MAAKKGKAKAKKPKAKKPKAAARRKLKVRQGTVTEVPAEASA